MRCYICDTEFKEGLAACPRCGTAYEVDIQRAIHDRSVPYGAHGPQSPEKGGGETEISRERMGRKAFQGGVEHARKGDYAAAESCFRRAARYLPADPNILFCWGSALFKQRRYLEAEARWREVSRLEHGSARTSKWLKRVEDILNADF